MLLHPGAPYATLYWSFFLHQVAHGKSNWHGQTRGRYYVFLRLYGKGSHFRPVPENRNFPIIIGDHRQQNLGGRRGELRRVHGGEVRLGR